MVLELKIVVTFGEEERGFDLKEKLQKTGNVPFLHLDDSFIDILTLYTYIILFHLIN
jgi:hypothetical protein